MLSQYLSGAGILVVYTVCVVYVHVRGESPTSKRDRSHITSILHLEDSLVKATAEVERINHYIKALKDIYNSAIKPVEELYSYPDLGLPSMSENDITASPMVLFVGPWSTGKSTMINYLIGIEDLIHQLRTGAEPTTSDFTVLMGGQQYRTVEGLVLAAEAHRGFGTLESFGQGFLEKLQGIEMPYPLLDKVVFVDTPGIIENRKQRERGYPFNDVMKWFIDRSDLIFAVFDPTKLDVGMELEMLFKQFKGRESQIRLILNKADSISMQELMRVYGALFWSMAPLINVTEPPRVYIGSFWDQPIKTNDTTLFHREERSLLHDLNQVIINQIENKIAFVRKHAVLVRIHALLVDRYLHVFNKKRSIFGDQDALLGSIIEDPDKYHIYHSVASSGEISRYDLPNPDVYQKFFSINALNSFSSISSHCSYFSGCVMDNLVSAIKEDLPNLLKHFTDESQGQTCASKHCDNKGQGGDQDEGHMEDYEGHIKGNEGHTSDNEGERKSEGETSTSSEGEGQSTEGEGYDSRNTYSEGKSNKVEGHDGGSESVSRKSDDL